MPFSASAAPPMRLLLWLLVASYCRIAAPWTGSGLVSTMPPAGATAERAGLPLDVLFPSRDMAYFFRHVYDTDVAFSNRGQGGGGGVSAGVLGINVMSGSDGSAACVSGSGTGSACRASFGSASANFDASGKPAGAGDAAAPPKEEARPAPPPPPGPFDRLWHLRTDGVSRLREVFDAFQREGKLGSRTAVSVVLPGEKYRTASFKGPNRTTFEE